MEEFHYYKYSIIFIALSSLLVSNVKTQDATENDVIQLYDTLLQGYNRRIRPIENQSAPLFLDFQTQLFNILEIDDVKQTIEILLLTSISWTDKNLTWTPSNYGGIEVMHFDHSEIWVPEVYVESKSFLDFPYRSYTTYDGTVSISAVSILKTACKLDMKRYPFDAHSCVFNFGILKSTVSSVMLHSLPSFLGRTLAQSNHLEWTLEDMWTEFVTLGYGPTAFSTASVNIKIYRESKYFLVTIVVPMFMLSVLSLASFLIPVETGERLSYALTTLLSLAVYGTMISGQMPRSSKPIPIILIYLTGVFIVSAVCVALTLVVTQFYWAKVIKVTRDKKTLVLLGITVTIARKTGIGFKNTKTTKKSKVAPSDDPETLHWGKGDTATLTNNPTGNPKEERSVQTTKYEEMNKKPLPCDDETRSIDNDDETLDEQTNEGADPDAIRLSNIVNWGSFFSLTFVFVVLTLYCFIDMTSG